MKRYLYEVDVWNSTKTSGFHDGSIPFMPRVLAERTVKALNRGFQKRYGYGHRSDVYKVSKTSLLAKDTTPHGYTDWFEFRRKKEK